jgi:membrane protein
VRPRAAARRALSHARRHRYWRFLRRYIDDTLTDRVPGLAAEMAFFVVLGIFPGLLIATGLLGVLDVLVGADVAATAKREVVSALQTVLTEQAAPAVASVEDLFEQSRGQLLTVATLGALMTLSGAFAVVIEALNLAYDTDEQRSWLRRRLLGLVMGVVTLAAAVLALAALVVGPLFGTGQDLAEVVGLGPLSSAAWTALRLPAVGVGLLVWTATLFHLAPNRRSRWRDSLPGAVLTTVLWIVASLGFHLYLTIAAGANPVIGAFGGGVIVMIWTYLLCLALLLGGELNALLERHDRRRGMDRHPSAGAARGALPARHGAGPSPQTHTDRNSHGPRDGSPGRHDRRSPGAGPRPSAH